MVRVPSYVVHDFMRVQHMMLVAVGRVTWQRRTKDHRSRDLKPNTPKCFGPKVLDLLMPTPHDMATLHTPTGFFV